MTREQIEQEAVKRAKERDIHYDEFIEYKDGFLAGAQWRIDSVWHDVGEVPERKDEPVLVEYQDWGSYGDEYQVIMADELEGFSSRAYSDLIRWAYISDLMPERKED